jgi:multidrug efflux pump subunit AcrA (membrane-fusion protein)
MYVSVNIPVVNKVPVDISNKLLVPVTALVTRDELTGIFTVGSANQALLRWLRTGKAYGDKVEVLSGLSKDEKFISSADGRLYNGAPVIVK